MEKLRIYIRKMNEDIYMLFESTRHKQVLIIFPFTSHPACTHSYIMIQGYTCKHIRDDKNHSISLSYIIFILSQR